MVIFLMDYLMDDSNLFFFELIRYIDERLVVARVISVSKMCLPEASTLLVASIDRTPLFAIDTHNLQENPSIFPSSHFVRTSSYCSWNLQKQKKNLELKCILLIQNLLLFFCIYFYKNDAAATLLIPLPRLFVIYTSDELQIQLYILAPMLIFCKMHVFGC